jgi:hypothetical protein
VRRHHIRTSAKLALGLIAIAIASLTSACGGSQSASPSPTSSCVNASAPHHAYIVVEHLSGAVVQKCVGFTTSTIDGKTLMDQSGIEYQAQTFSFGSAVCQVDKEPQQFTQCFPQNMPYWALFIEAGGTWTTAQNGYTQAVLNDKDALGWHYVQAADPSPAPPPPAKV